MSGASSKNPWREGDPVSTSLPPDVRDLLTLRLVPGLGPRLTAALLERFGSAGAALRASVEELEQIPHIGSKLARDLVQSMRSADVAAELERVERHRARLVALGGTDYPAALANIHDPPHLLYVRGTLEARDADAVALVGSRHCTPYGKRVAERLAGELARAGWTVVSGLARGIDGCAHRGALKAGGRTLAVLAGGLSRIYPPEHAELAGQVEAQGALLSEAAMGMEPLAALFPPRNRIISGLSRAVVIVEANEKSGALITAGQAAEQGRTVFAVPGPIDSPASAGTNALLRQGAVLVRGVEDIMEELVGVRTAVAPARAAEPPPGMDDVQRRVWEFLAEQPRHLDELAQGLSLAVSQLSGVLLMLEMKKVVRRLPGNRYERC
jgi:DNA processing protein